MYNWDGGSSWGAWLAMSFMMVLFWGFIAVLVVYLVRFPTARSDDRPRTSTLPDESAMQILDARFARGEIEAEEYMKRRDLLQSP
jgi:putative membrane protein